MPELADLAQRLLRAYPGRRDEALAVINGALGDRLAAANSPLAVAMRLHRDHALTPLDDPPLALPDARPGACLFVHGLMGSERAWRFGVRPPDTDDAQPPRVDFGHALAQARDQTALYLRYNTGRHISENGRELADMLERALTLPGGPRELTIVAHSMGGLVTRSACHYALEAGHAWIARLRRVFLLGVPSRGARLEQLAHLTTATLTAIWNPWTKLIGAAINQRSAGIKDLRHGFVLDEDWQDFDPDRLAWPVPTRPREPADVRWFVALGTLGDPDSAVAQTLGDGLVHPGSAQGVSLDPRARELLPPAEVQRFPSTGHLALMNDPAVLAQLLEWWEA